MPHETWKWEFDNKYSLNAELGEHEGEWVIRVFWVRPNAQRANEPIIIHLDGGAECLTGLASFAESLRRRCLAGEVPFGKSPFPRP